MRRIKLQLKQIQIYFLQNHYKSIIKPTNYIKRLNGAANEKIPYNH